MNPRFLDVNARVISYIPFARFRKLVLTDVPGRGFEKTGLSSC
jgi:hypothetical protein